MPCFLLYSLQKGFCNQTIVSWVPRLQIHTFVVLVCTIWRFVVKWPVRQWWGSISPKRIDVNITKLRNFLILSRTFFKSDHKFTFCVSIQWFEWGVKLFCRPSNCFKNFKNVTIWIVFCFSPTNDCSLACPSTESYV